MLNTNVHRFEREVHEVTLGAISGTNAAMIASALLAPRLAMNDAAVSTGDWNLLLDAVILRLQRCVGESLSLESVRPVQATSKSMQVGVLECVDALGHLQEMLCLERKLHQQLESAFLELKATLTEARAERRAGADQ